MCISSAIRQNGESQSGCYKKTKHTKFSERRTFLTPWVSGGKKYLYFGKSGVVCFLVTPVSRFVLCLITDDLFFADLKNSFYIRNCWRQLNLPLYFYLITADIKIVFPTPVFANSLHWRETPLNRVREKFGPSKLN